MLQKKPLVSIIIPVYNGSNYLRDAIESAFRQTYENCEVIVVNDGSNDGGKTEKICKSYGRKIKYIAKENGGVASALNIGSQAMNGDYFSWLSHDDVFFNTKIDRQMAFILASGNPQTIAEGNYAFMITATGGEVRTAFERYFPMKCIQNGVFPLLWLETHFSNLLFHVNHFERVGFFDEKNITAQDQDMQFRLLRGQQTVFVADPVSMFRIHSESGTNKMQDRLFEENRKWYLQIMQILTDAEKTNVFNHPSILDCRICSILLSMDKGKELRQAEATLKSELEPTSEVTLLQKELKNQKFVIFGAGQYGRRLNFELQARRLYPTCFIDNNLDKQETFIDGVMCYSVEILHGMENVDVIIGQKMYADAYRQIQAFSLHRIWLKDEIDALLFVTRPMQIPEFRIGGLIDEMGK